MTEVSARELRNDMAAVLRRVESGEEVVVTSRNRPVAQLLPLPAPGRRWLSRRDLVDRLRAAQADPGLARDLAELTGETTDDLDPVP